MKTLLIILLLCSALWCDELPTIEKYFKKFGQYEFQNEFGCTVMKSYYSSQELSLSWLNAFAMCKTFNMDLVELPTEAEADYFLTQCKQHISQSAGTNYVIGASYVGAGLNEFYWMTTGKQIKYTMKYVPGQPDNFLGNEKYLSITRHQDAYMINDTDDMTKHYFICQRMTNENCVNERFHKPNCTSQIFK